MRGRTAVKSHRQSFGLVALAAVTLIGQLAAAAPAAAQPFVYAVGQRDDDPGPGTVGIQTVVVFDTATNQRVAVVPVGRSCRCLAPNGIAVRPDGSRVYVVNHYDRTVSIIGAPSHTVVATKSSGHGVSAVTVSPDGARYYLTAHPQVGNSFLQVFSTDTDTLLQTIPLGNIPITGGGMVVSPDGRRLYLTANSTTLVVVDLVAGAVERSVPASTPFAPAITPDGRLIFVRNSSLLAPAVTVMQTSDLQSVAVVPADIIGENLSVHPDGGRLYVAGHPSRVVSTTTRTIVGTLTGHSVRQVAITPDGRRLYGTGSVYGGVPSQILVADAQTYALVAALPWDDAAHGPPGPIAMAAPTRPPAPTDLRSRVYGTSVTLWWTPPAGVAGPVSYVVEAGSSPGAPLVRLPIASSVFSVVAPPGTWYVRVRSVVGGVEGPASEEIPVVVNPSAPPSSPTHLLGLAHGSSMVLTWKNPQSGGVATSLVLDVNGAVTTSLPLPLGESFSYTPVPPGTYTFTIRAVNAGAASGPSNTVTLSFPSACSGPPNAPENVTLSHAGGLVSVSWDPPSSGPAPSAYLLHVTGDLQAIIPVPSRSIGGTVAPGTYHVAVGATNACGPGPIGPAQTITVP